MTDTKELIEKYGIRANKSLGQNFLHKADIINSIADAACVTPHALEIGAGLGVLTRALCERFESVTTVEIDRSLKDVTDESLRGVTNHTMVYADFLRYKTDTLPDDITVVGNLPYNITGDIVTKLLKNASRIRRAVIMIQREAAEKLSAAPARREYRAISVLTQFYCDISTLCDVSPDSFIPAPSVYSRVLILDFKKDRDYDPAFSEFVHRVFNQRRKQLASIFKTAEHKESVRKALTSLGVPENARGEELSPDVLYNLYKLLIKMKVL